MSGEKSWLDEVEVELREVKRYVSDLNYGMKGLPCSPLHPILLCLLY